MVPQLPFERDPTQPVAGPARGLKDHQQLSFTAPLVVSPEPNPAHAGLSQEEVTAANRAQCEAALAHDLATRFKH